MKYDFLKDLVIEGMEDEVGIWEIIYHIRHDFPSANFNEIRLMTLESIRELLESGFMKIGVFEPNSKNELEFKIWDLDINAILHKIEAQWDTLGREPNIGDIGWFITTESGKIEAEKMKI